MKVSKKVLLAGVGAGVLTIGGTVAYASIPDSSGVIHGCIKSNSMLKVIDSDTTSCAAGETPLTWSQTGPAGPAGADGAQGPVGPGGTAFFYGLTQDKTSPAGSGAATDLVCDSGDIATGGGYHIDATDVYASTSEPYGIDGNGARGWTVTVYNNTATDVNFQTRVVCLDAAPFRAH